MTGKNERLRVIPQMSALLKAPRLLEAAEIYGGSMVRACARDLLKQLRQDILAGQFEGVINQNQLIEKILAQVKKEGRMNLRPLINGTGIILHTNLGRAVLSDVAAQAAYDVARNYSNLEYDCETGSRGSRYSHVDGLLKKICNCESAMVVNNNAAAVLLILSTLAKNKEVIVSRGELVEIGGSFRVPEVMEQSGAHLVEVGSTNRTKKADYQKAIAPDKTGALLKVHTSNYKIVGFTEELSLAELVEIGKDQGIPVVYDLGSGGFFKSADFSLGDEPSVYEAVKTGADLICFSGDKLLGGPQAGIIVGKKKYLEAMKKNPLTRALRIDKMTLAALEATLRLYLDWEKAKKEIPILKSLAIPLADLSEKASDLSSLLNKNSGVSTEILEASGQVGGGSLPNQMLPSICVSVKIKNFPVNQLENYLRRFETAIIGRIQKGLFLLDMRTIDLKDFVMINRAFRDLSAELEQAK